MLCAVDIKAGLGSSKLSGAEERKSDTQNALIWMEGGGQPQSWPLFT